MWFWGLTGISEVWGVSYSGLLISDFRGFSEMVAASGVSFYTGVSPLPLGFLPEHTPLCNQASSPYDLWFPRGRQGLKVCSSFRRHRACLIYILLVRQFQRPEGEGTWSSTSGWEVCQRTWRPLFKKQLFHAACRTLVPWPEIELVPLVVETRSPNYWIARGFLTKPFIFSFSAIIFLV